MIEKRTIVVNINPKKAKKEKVSVLILSDTLRKIQQFAYNLGISRIEREPSLPGPYPSFIRRELELFIIKAKSGSFTATLTFPEKETSLFPNFPDFTERIVEDMHKFILAIKNRNPDVMQKTIPNPKYRKRILDNLIPIMPPKKSDYDITFKFGNYSSISKVDRPNEKEILSFIGKYEEVEREKPKEAIIQARCLAQLKEDGEIEKIIKILNYELFEEVDLRPYRTIEIEWLNRKFILSKEIACDTRKEDPFTIVEYEPLNIKAYNYSREEAIEDFSEEFAFIWDCYAQEEDANLTSDAIFLKNQLLSLVKKIEKK